MEEQLFSKPAVPAQPIAMPSPQISGLATRVKLVEERYANLVKRNQITEESLLGFERDMKAELRAISSQTVTLRKHLQEIMGKLDGMQGELSAVVHKHEFQTVERYLDLWQPMQFITREEAKRLIADAMEARRTAPPAIPMSAVPEPSTAPASTIKASPVPIPKPAPQAKPVHRRSVRHA
jgi:hypothetical protein